MRGIFSAFFRHKVFVIVVLIVLGVVAYGIYRNTVQFRVSVRSVLGKVERGILNISVSGTGEISASNQLDIKPKVSGDIVAMRVKEGSRVKEGDILSLIDSRDAQKAVRDAKNNLASAQLALDKLITPADRLALLQARNALDSAKETYQRAEQDLETARLDLDKLRFFSADSLSVTQAKNARFAAQDTRTKADDMLKKAYDDAFTVAVSAFLDFSGLLSNIDDMFFQSSIEKNKLNIDWYAKQVSSWDDSTKTAQYQQDATASYDTAQAQYEKALATYKTVTRSSDYAMLDALILQTSDAATGLDASIKSAKIFLDYIHDRLGVHSVSSPSILTTHRTALDGYMSKINATVSGMANARRSVQEAVVAVASTQRTLSEKEEALAKIVKNPDPLDIRAQELVVGQREKARADARRSVDEKYEALKKLEAGADTLDIRAQELTIQQRKNDLEDTLEKLVDYTIKAPFDGIIATNTDVKKGDAVSPSTILATIITQKKIAKVTFNEVDVSRIAVGQKAILTVDALPSVSFTGSVAQIDTLGTSSQGVVSYTVHISIDTTNERVMPGMTVSATVITDTRTDTLFVPSVSIKSDGDRSYVMKPYVDDESTTPTKPPQRVDVQTGLSNYEYTEILSGLSEGDSIVINTFSYSPNDSANSRSSQQKTPAFRIPGLPGAGGGGGGFRGNDSGMRR